MAKTIIKLGNFATSGGTTQTFTPALDGQNNHVIGNATTEYCEMDIMFNVKTLTGTSVTPSFQERFSDIGFVETGNYGAITATGVYTLSSQGQSGQTGTNNIKYGFGCMGHGTDKQVVFTNSSISAISIDVYAIFYK